MTMDATRLIAVVLTEAHGRGRCNLCLKEAYYIFYPSEPSQQESQMCTVDRRQDVFSVCFQCVFIVIKSTSRTYKKIRSRKK